MLRHGEKNRPPDVLGRSIRCKNFVWNGLSGISMGALLAGVSNVNGERRCLFGDVLPILRG